MEFLGRVIANISHELKNALATVHETAGLLSDILRSSDDPTSEADEIRGCADSISEELDRAFGVIRNLNVFAHSADRPWEELDPTDTVELTAALVGYLSYAGRARLVAGETRPVRVVTCPLLLGDLVYRILGSAYRAGGRETKISLSVHEWGDGAEIRISGLGRRAPAEILPDATRPILLALSADVSIDEEGEALRIRLPAEAGGSAGG